MRRSQNFARTHTGRKRGKISKFVKYFPMNQFIKGSTSGLVMKKLEETWGVKITSSRTWPFFSAVTLLHPLPFKNSRSHKNCDFDSETFGLPIPLWS